MDQTKMNKIDSASIERLEPDGTAAMIIEHIAKADEIVSLKDIEQKGDEATRLYTATNLTEKPTEQVVGKSEVQKVHNFKKEFPAWLDGKPVTVVMKDNLVESA